MQQVVEINLLPWRIYLRAYQETRLIRYSIIMAVFFIIALLGTHCVFIFKLKSARESVLKLENNLTYLAEQTKSVQVVSPVLNLLNQFENNKVHVANFFNQLFDSTPEDIVWLTILTQDEQVYLTGKTNSFQSLLSFAKSFEVAQHPFRVNIIKVKSLPHSDFFQFSLQFFQVIPPVQH